MPEREGKMKRRTFLGARGAASVGTALGSAGVSQPTVQDVVNEKTSNVRLAGMSLPELRQELHDELFKVQLPFWDQHGIDHENGGVMCSLDYDGALVNTDKLMWFQGRAIWIYSFLYNHFGQDERYLEIARKAKEFVFHHALQADGWWAEKFTREGKVLKPFGGDIEGIYFIAEGLQEYGVAAKDEQARKMAGDLLKK